MRSFIAFALVLSVAVGFAQTGTVLVAGGYTPPPASDYAKAEVFSSGSFVPTANMNVPRAGHAAAALQNAANEVLIVGGVTDAGSLTASAEIFNPAKGGSFSRTSGDMTEPRLQPTATRLLTGSILIAGGSKDDGSTLSSAELYRPASKLRDFVPTPVMIQSRAAHTATLMGNTRLVLIAGGFTNPPLGWTQIAELYDPSSGAWGTFGRTGDMRIARANHAAVWLPTTRMVLIVGGDSGAPSNGSTIFASAELYDPVTGQFTLLPQSMTVPRSKPTATFLPKLGTQGKVLITGGHGVPYGLNGSLASAEFYDIATQTFTSTADMSVPRENHTATLLADRTVLIAGGQDTGSGITHKTAEIYNPQSGMWSAPVPMATARSTHIATRF